MYDKFGGLLWWRYKRQWMKKWHLPGLEQSIWCCPAKQACPYLERQGFDQYSTWWIRNWLDDFSQKSCSISIKRPVTTAVPQGSVPAPSLFNVFVSDTVRDDTVTGIEGTLGKFASNTKLCRAVDMLEERNAKEVGPCEASNSTRPSTRSCILVGVIPSTTQAGQRSD